MSFRQYRAWANEAWGSSCDAVAGNSVSIDFRRGFIDGFADYCYAGGSGEPPVVPPRFFWSIRYRNAAGDQRIEDWRRGFRLGAQAADEGGYRKRAVVPAALAGVDAGGTEYAASENWDHENWDHENWDESWDLTPTEILPLPTEPTPAVDDSRVLIEAPSSELNGPEARRTTTRVSNLIGKAKRDAYKEGGASR